MTQPHTGSLADADATFAVFVEHGDAANLSDAAAVADDLLLGTEAEASFDQDDDDSAFCIGYIGGKRYVRLTVTPAGNAAAAVLSALAILGKPKVAPIAWGLRRKGRGIARNLRLPPLRSTLVYR